MHPQHDKPASFHALRRRRCRRRPRSSSTSPACTRAPASTRPTSSPSSTPRRADRPRDADAERRRRAPPLRLEPLPLGLPRAGPLAPDRPGLPLLADPRRQRRRRPAAAADREGDRAGRARARRPATPARTPSTACPATTSSSRCSATPTATAPAASPSSTRRRSRSRAAGRTAARRPPLNYDFWYQPRKNVLVSSEFGEPNAYEPGFDLDDVEAGRYGQRLHFWNLERARARADDRPRRERAHPARGPLAARPRGRRGLRRRRALERRSGTSTARTARWAAEPVIEVEPRRRSRAGRSRCRD